ncbi:MotA/TolQ/ExbB proton channel family protein, partial [Sulfobacillus acidophilus]|nr:MotA/TolQ/ExbB proton channel family protein [Sulfobacillus acidophilus]
NIFQSGYNEILQHKKDGTKDTSAVERALQRAFTFEMAKLEKRVSFLATVGSVSPYIGLFGTVVGIINSLHQMGLKGSVSLTVVAPGIAEALLATGVGLFAAIPAVMAYNYFSARLRSVAICLDNFNKDFMSQYKRYL